ncbi:MAG: hypothetical protein A3A94_01930 [Candidatus Portnoybacteria bacterium RIFCSPLOWO2_01_FULL_43_11]|uniref:Uncharacterized protein n=3 Tax=Bacteria candidate phyla TaxID=1783234 RepID=A0A1G2FMN7_9BACT|nr:MAG: hypothetical protein A2713_01075 [candidate division WWE3 bacterium RIFCSPHIGHO2_01_FULL_35_17]OGZ36538.1 MAG: hypothetical protein A3D38_01055 [Candidatus Portnoybacteria bacterium RIFCSPHIGHO2_02_FULL_40_23]OGZ39062.1 MAG: hypothetical protein A3A94_01930 [Candidatus Portnoybacteria bacterium RIFCSPLOWO2_01_FULL_43_11]OGZ39339.1 MAG: hypothetical protein A3E90_01255 [Candidatus Portnoybacteria bacterium RIFCSPHIGHO2_12_FULL_40_11]
MDFFKKRILLFIVFITGASVLIIEVLATRILAVYYGNTIYTISSVIGIILAAPLFRQLFFFSAKFFTLDNFAIRH